MSNWPIAYKESVSAVTGTKPAGIDLGTLRYEGGKMYQYIYNGGNTAIDPTMGCCLLSGATGYTVTISSVASYTVMFGLVENATITTSAYGWVLKQGIATFEGGAGSFQAAIPVVQGANGVFEPGTTLIGTTVSTTYNAFAVVGNALGSFATGASGLGYFRFV
jgi:hypothetical protein